MKEYPIGGAAKKRTARFQPSAFRIFFATFIHAPGVSPPNAARPGRGRGNIVKRLGRDLIGFFMEINIKSLKFDADQKLIDYIDKKVSKLAKFHEGTSVAEVTLSLLQEPANKCVKLKIHTPGEDHLIERNSHSFEDAVNNCVDAMREKLTRSKERHLEA